MENPTSTQAQVQHYLALMKRRRILIVVCTVLGVMFASFLAVSLPKRWSAETQLKLARQGYFDQIVGERSSDIPFSDKLANVKSEMTATETVRQILNDLNWREFKELIEDDQNSFIDKIVDNIEVATERSENADDLVTFGFTWNDPNRTVNYLTAMRDHWVRNSVEFYKTTLLRRKTFAMKNVELRDKALRQSRETLRIWQQTQGSLDILAVDPDDNTLVNRQSSLEGRKSDALQRTTRLDAEIPALEAALLDIPQQKTIANLSPNEDHAKLALELGALERKVESLGKYLTEEHPTYRRALEELEELQAKLGDVPESLTSTTTEDYNPAYVDFKKDIDLKKAERAGYKNEIVLITEELKELQKEVHNLPSLLESQARLQATVARHEISFTEATKKLNSYEDKLGEANLVTPWQILEEPRKPKSPSFPSVPLFVIAGLFLGAMVGVGLTFLFEFVNFSFRSIDEAVRGLPVPVLGAVNTIITEIEIRRKRLRRMLYLSFSTLLVAVVATAGVIWYQFPDVIPPSLIDAINDLRRRFL